MRFSGSLLTFSVLALAVASPIPKKAKASATSSASNSTATAAVSAAAAPGGSVLTASTYNDIQISSGTAGTAETQANAIFANIDMTNLASVSASDLKIIKGIHDAAEDAETSAFNTAIAAASGDAATVLHVR